MSKFFRGGLNWYQQQNFFVRAALVAAVVVGGYLAIPDSLTHPFHCKLDNVNLEKRTNYQSTNGFFIDNQVIVIGPAENIKNVINKLATNDKPNEPKVELLLVDGCDLRYLVKWHPLFPVSQVSQTPGATSTSPTQTLEVPSPSAIQTTQQANSLDKANSLFSEEQRESLEMHLYEIPADSGVTVEKVIEWFNRIRNDVGTDKTEQSVFVDPNYNISLLDEESGECGQPYAGGGSPYAGGGSPYAGGGSPYAGGGSPYAGGGSPSAGPGISREDFSNQFMQQWSFRQRGINLQDSTILKGFGVRVGVFDTSPFRKSYLWFPRTIQIAQSYPLRLAPRNAMGPDPISNHGLFVSGLIHAIAPNSKIELIRVLNDNGCGNLWEIDKALLNFISRRRSAWTGKLNRVVINLSLGVHIPDETNIGRTQGPSDNRHVDWEQLRRELDGLHAYSFEETIYKAHDLGAVIVAAAGNDSAPPLDVRTSEANGMQVPASYPDVIGVAATNLNGDRACYSNRGDVAAPGGDGGLASIQTPDGTTLWNYCAPRAVTWDLEPEPESPDSTITLACDDNDMANCDFGLMSLLIVPDQNGRWKYDYGLWSGTSFSTALVSGLAALSFEKAGANPEKVECLIYRRPPPIQAEDDLGIGIINIEKSLTDESILSTCRNIQ